MSENKEKKKKRSKFKIGCLGIIIIIIIFIIIAIASAPSGSASASTSGTTSSSTIQTKLGQTFKMGNYNVKLSDIRNTQNISSGGMTLNSTKNNYFIVKMTIENMSSSPIPAIEVANDFSDTKVLTLKENGKTFNVNADESLNTDITSSNNAFNTAFSGGGNINPNTPYSSDLVINTPKPVKNGELIINIAGDTATIKV